MSKGGGGGGGGGSGGDENAYAMLWILAVIAVVVGVVWYFFKNQLIQAFIAIKKYEILAVSFFINNENIQKAIQWTERVTPETIGAQEAQIISTFIGQYLMYPICFILIVMAIIMLKGTAT
ncbi:MAG TPA: hypothetical protein PLD88_03065, partial [Candidatus Berkiella sp.]|nr:hypothetical protein [Candidatus Berkiella sp.]